MDVVFVGEGFTDDGVVARGKLTQHDGRRIARKELSSLAEFRWTDVYRREGCGQALVFHVVGAEAADGGDAGKSRDAAGELRLDGRVTIAAGLTCGTNVEVGGKLALHPGDDGLAKAADHDAD